MGDSMLKEKSKYRKKSAIDSKSDQSIGRLFNAFYTEISALHLIAKTSPGDTPIESEKEYYKIDNIISSIKLLVDIIIGYKAMDHDSILGYAPREKIALMDAMIKDLDIIYSDKSSLSKQIRIYRVNEICACFVDLVDLVYCDNQALAFNDVSHISDIIDCIKLLYKNHNKINETREDPKYLKIIFDFIQKSIPHDNEVMIINFIKSSF